MRSILVAALLAAGTMPALAAASESTASNATGPERERRICRRLDAGRSESRVTRRRVCLTAAQWRSRAESPIDDFVDTMEVRSRAPESGTYSGGNAQSPN
jgi:hypothetical protein